MTELEVETNQVLQQIEAGLTRLHSLRGQFSEQNIKFPPSQFNLITDTLCGFGDLLEAMPQLARVCSCVGNGGTLQDCVADCCSSEAPKR